MASSSPIKTLRQHVVDILKENYGAPRSGLTHESVANTVAQVVAEHLRQAVWAGLSEPPMHHPPGDKAGHPTWTCHSRGCLKKEK